MTQTYTVHGAHESYFTGKMEAYLRAKGIPYRNQPFSPTGLRDCASHTGVMQIPQIQCPDGSWLVDTTPTMQFFERSYDGPALSPEDPALRFVSRLIEDYGDEWLWRPAMHYRWSYKESARLASYWLGQHLTEYPLPSFAKTLFWRLRQTLVFVRGDGVNGRTRGAVEDSYLSTLDAMEAIFLGRPFLLGERPVEADFGLFASMYRHFFCDPASGRIMRERAPGVQEWVARMWNMTPERTAAGSMPSEIPTHLEPLMAAIAEIYLPYLLANEEAFAHAQHNVSYHVQGVGWTEPTKPYRVWCLNRLREEFAALATADRERVVQTIANAKAIDILDSTPASTPPPGLPELPIPAGHAAVPMDSWWRR
ncbi:MAG: glutathione S-transferase [Hyphomicrobiaceae bacterium]|jgi:glutathione S-transferase